MRESKRGKTRGGLRIQPENVPSGCFTRKTLLDTIRRNGRASRTQLAELTGLTFMAVKRNMEELLDRYKDELRPAIILIPGREGSLGIGKENLQRAIERAVGADIL